MKDGSTGFLARFEEQVAETAAVTSKGFSPMRPVRERVCFETLVAAVGQNQLASEIARLENAETMAGGGADEPTDESRAHRPPPGTRTHLGLSHQLRPIRMLSMAETKK